VAGATVGCTSFVLLLAFGRYSAGLADPFPLVLFAIRKRISFVRLCLFLVAEVVGALLAGVLVQSGGGWSAGNQSAFETDPPLLFCLSFQLSSVFLSCVAYHVAFSKKSITTSAMLPPYGAAVISVARAGQALLASSTRSPLPNTAFLVALSVW